MGLLGSLFDKSDEKAISHGHVADIVQWEGGGVKYDPGLIPRLVQEHRSLLDLFSAIRRAYQSQNFGSVRRALDEFKQALSAHLLAEDVRFYAYVKNGLSHDKEKLAAMTAFWKDMQRTSRTVLQFLAKYETFGFILEEPGAFAKELEGIGATLVERMRHEEDRLYGLYLPSYEG